MSNQTVHETHQGKLRNVAYRRSRKRHKQAVIPPPEFKADFKIDVFSRGADRNHREPPAWLYGTNTSQALPMRLVDVNRLSPLSNIQHVKSDLLEFQRDQLKGH